MITPEIFERNFLECISENSLISKGDKVLVAFSGGVDSSVLLSVLHHFADDLQITIGAAYFNHNLRGDESLREDDFVKDFAKKRNITLLKGDGDVLAFAKQHKLSLQESARKLRYDFLEKASVQHSFTKIATAHHKDDQIETVLMRFLQGAGINGLRGIPIERDVCIRPMLSLAKEEIMLYAHAKKIPFFSDSSNTSQKYVRNKIRNRILPYLKKEMGTNLDKILFDHGKGFGEYADYLEKSSKAALNNAVIEQQNDKIVLDISVYKSYFTLLQQNAVFDCFRMLGDHAEPRFRSYFNKINTYLSGTLKRSHLYISREIFVYADGNALHICRDRDASLNSPVELGKSYEFQAEGFSFTAKEVEVGDTKMLDSCFNKEDRNKEFVDGELLSGSLRLRSWKTGDRFNPFGMSGSKKLSDFFIDLKLKPDIKKNTPLLVDDEKIVWVCGLRVDNRVRVTDNTNKVVGLTYSRNENIGNLA